MKMVAKFSTHWIGLSKVLTSHSTHFRSFRRWWGDWQTYYCDAPSVF